MLSAISGDEDDDFEEAHEINVTPFIDVMLVLLIIFMVAAPLSTVDLPVNLPSSTAIPQQEAGQADLYHHQARSRRGGGRDAGQARRYRPVFGCAGRSDQGRIGSEGKDRRFFPARGSDGVPYGELMDVLERLRDRRLP